jgi:uncharacterized protein (DUF885 family)
MCRLQLGDGFDIKGFHDVWLTSGAMILPRLAELIEVGLGRGREA